MEAQARVYYFVADLTGKPRRVEYPTILDPRVWPTEPKVLVYLEGNVIDQQFESLVEYALDLGWGYNPHTRCFYRLD